MRVRRLALLALLTLVAPVEQAWPLGALPANAGGPGITVLSTSQWFEVIDPVLNLRAYHLVGEVRNDAGVNVTGIQLHLNLFDASSNPVGTRSTISTVQVLAPGERSPFEAILFPPPANYASFTVVQPIPFAQSVEQPDHQFLVTIDPCPNPDPTSPVCQNHLSGIVQNPSTAPTVHGVAAIFTFYDTAGGVVTQDRTDVTNAAGDPTLAPGGLGHFSLDRTGEPAWSTRALIVEPQYPVDVNPSTLDFGNQRVGSASTTEDVALLNNGPDPVAILSATASGEFSVAGLTCATIAPSSSCRVNIQFTPTAMGARTGTLIVTENVAGSPDTIPLTGTGVAPVLTLNPTSLDFGPQAVGTTSAAKTVALTNTGTDTLNISGIGVSGDFAAGQCPSSVSPGHSCNLSVTFSPLSGGPRTGALTIMDDTAGSPHTVPLSGTGLGPGVAFTPLSLDFGAVSVGSSSSRPVQLANSGSAALAISSIASSGDFQVSDSCPMSPATLAAGSNCIITLTFIPAAPGARSGSMVVSDNAGDSPQVYGLKGLGAQATYSAVITSQATLVNSDGVTWQLVDPRLTLTIKPTDNEAVLLSSNADLWTATPGVNQDLGITVSVGGGPDTLLFWKESGGFAGTFSPNAAFVHGNYSMAAGFTYVLKLVWKANTGAPGTRIFAGAGPVGSAFSPTRLTAQLAPTGVASAAITKQPQLRGSDGSTWSDIDPALTASFSGSLGTSTMITGNADLWTATAGINQDLGIFVTIPGGLPQLVAWKESGGSAGTFSPNAAYVQAVVATPAAGTYQVSLKWKTNVNAPGSIIVAGAGPINGRFSPTTLTVQMMDAPTIDDTLATRQSILAGSDGISWAPLGSLIVTLPPSTSNAVAVVGANADLWTNTSGYNQDLGIFLSIDYGPDVLVGWKESGGFAGVFSPNAAFAQAVVPMPSGHSYRFSLEWKTNRPEGSATIAAGAGPIGTAYSPTSLTVQVTAD